MGVLETLRAEGVAIGQAPWSFAICVAVVTGVLFVVLRAFKAQEIADLHSRLTLKSDEAADYRRKLDGATPEEARARVTKLELEVQQLKSAVSHRRINADIRNALDRITATKPVKITYNASAEDGPELATEIRDYLRRRGALFVGGNIATITGSAPKGLIVTEHDEQWRVWIGHKPSH
jgi:hypothetical protein